MSTEDRRRRLINIYKSQSATLHRENLELHRNIPVPQWDRGVFLEVARDRGYRTESALAYEISQKLQCSVNRAKKMISTGRMSWGEVLCLGAVLEMTPREFCDCFLHDYFKPYAEDVYRASVDDFDALLREPRRIFRRSTEDGWNLITEDLPRRGVSCLVTTEDGKVMTATYNIKRGYPPTQLKWITPHGKIIKVKAWKRLDEPCKRKVRNDD